MKLTLMFLILALASVAHAKNWDGIIYNVKTNSEITSAEYINDLSNFSIIVLGEKHYTPAVQFAQAKTIRNVVDATGKSGAFTTGWEFLNVTSQSVTDGLFTQVKSKQMSAATFLEKTQNNSTSMSYGPIIDATALLGGKLLGMNLSRLEKAPVTEKGIEALDPKLLPPGFGYGTAGYFERFNEAMQGHATPEQVKNYYASQCLVDDVMAYHLLKDSNNELNFLIVGSFHTDFYDGAVNRIKIRSPGIAIVAVKIIDASDFEEKDLLEQVHSDQYGDIADYVYFVNNPNSLMTHKHTK